MIKKLYIAILSALLGAASLAQADDIDNGKWNVVTTDPTMMYAVVFNDSGALFGQYCYPDKGTCLWLISISTQCEKDHKYPVLANSDGDGGAMQLTIQCQGSIGGEGKDAKYAYVFTDFDSVTSLLKNGKRVGFTIPLQSDQFKVVRFNLQGAEKAISQMRDKASEAMDESKSKNTKDQDL
jgi:hypothetical protein